MANLAVAVKMIVFGLILGSPPHREANAMPAFERLLRMALLQHEANDFPAHLLREVEGVFADAGTFTGREALVEELATQIENFDPYAGTGCFDESCSAATIAATLKRLKESAGERP